MPSKHRDWKHEYQLQKKRGEDKDQLVRQKARQMYDRKGIDREGKDIDHKVPLSKGGSNSTGNLRLTSRKANRSYARNKDGSVK